MNELIEIAEALEKAVRCELLAVEKLPRSRPGVTEHFYGLRDALTQVSRLKQGLLRLS